MRSFTLMVAVLCSITNLLTQTNNLPDISLEVFATGFDNPVGVEHAGTSDLYVVEQTGKVRIVDTQGNHKSHFLNLTDKISSAGFEQGLLGIAFHPDYATNGYFYVHYTNLDGNSTISRFTVNKHNRKKVLPSSEVIMFVNDDPFSNHNSGQMKFGPDGYLYFTIGDGGSGGDPFNNAQNISTTFGKLLRIDPTADGGYDIPADNPYADVVGAAPEIYATGLRNPWRFSFDLLTGDLWIPDVGQNAWEEVNVSPGNPAGVNYGWSCREGFVMFKDDCDANETPFTDPVAVYAHDNNPEFPCSGSITGGYVYRGDQYPDMYGKYFYTDFCTGVIRTTWWDGTNWATADLGNFTPFAYSTFGEDINGELYLVDKTAGVIYRFQDEGTPGFRNIAEHYDNDVNNFGLTRYEEAATDVDNDELIRQQIHQQSISSLNVVLTNEMVMTPNPNHGQFSLWIEADIDAPAILTISDLTGRVIVQEKQELTEGTNEWKLWSASLVPGMYMAQLRNSNKISTINFVVD